MPSATPRPPSAMTPCAWTRRALTLGAALVATAAAASPTRTPASGARDAAAATGSPLAAAQPSQAPAATVAEAIELLRQAAGADESASRALAERALPALLPASRRDGADCTTLILTAEAQVRAGRAKDALATLGRASTAECDEAAVAHLAGWANEYGEDGERRGRGAALDRAESLYLHAAVLYATQPDAADSVAAALGAAGELALLRDDRVKAQELGLKGLDARPSDGLVAQCALLVLRAAGPRIGEGAATDLIATRIEPELLKQILDARTVEIKKGLDASPGDPQLHCAAAFYSLFTGGDLGTALARRHVVEASKSGWKLVELEYLRGRVALDMDDPATAKEAWRKQVADFPDALASRLAANELAHLLGTAGGSADEMGSALALLDEQLAKAPGEAAMHETRSLLLERMGRRADAAAAMRRAAEIEPTPERSAAVTRLSSGG